MAAPRRLEHNPPMVTVSSPSDLPLPSAAARVHSDRLCAHIAAEIMQAGGSIGFDRYMELALYAPGLGYYSAGAAKFGPEGDFVTAPELTPLFGRTLAGPCAQWLAQLGADAWVLELGAGGGVLAADVAAALAQRGRLPATYAILERSAELRERQRQLLHHRVPELLDRVRWLDALPDVPIDGVLLANEVLDALPVVRARRTDAGWRELRVSGDAAQGFADVLAPASPQLTGQLEAIEAVLGQTLPPGYTTEIQPWLPAWMASLGASFSRGRCCGSTTACRAISTITLNGRPAPCAATIATAPSMIPIGGRACRTLPPGSISRRSPRPRRPPAGRWRAIPRRPRS